MLSITLSSQLRKMTKVLILRELVSKSLGAYNRKQSICWHNKISKILPKMNKMTASEKACLAF
jgi:hypothetical protein